MFSFILTNLSRKVLWLALAVIFSVFVMFQLFGAVVKRTTSTTGSASCARTVASSTNQYQQYTSAVLAAAPNRAMAEDAADDGAIEFVSDVLLYPANIIVADGHRVKITGQTVAQYGPTAKTKVWVDENDNGVEDDGECIEGLSSYMSSVYLYGGFDSETDENSCDNISITMEGGEIGAIFAGGYYKNVTTGNVDIRITGGSVLYVDCGSQAGPLNERLKANSISVLLKDCRYRSNFAINFITRNSFNCNDVTVIDLADHRNTHSYTWLKPAFNNYISQIDKNRFIFGGHVTIPADCSINAEKLVVEGATVNNLGKVAISTCADIHMLDDAQWIGNEIETTHSLGEILSHDYKTHTQQCSVCGQKVSRDHVWTYPQTDGNTHLKQCAICQYSYFESCTQQTIYNHTLIKTTGCAYCGSTTTPSSSNNTLGHLSTCTHSSRNSMTVTRNHHDLLPDGMVDYSINQLVYFCSNANCKAMLPFRMYYGSAYYYFRGLTEVSQFVTKNKITNASVTMLSDAFYQNDYSTLDSVYAYVNGSTVGTLNIEMSGFEMNDRKLLFYAGNINITNSRFGTNHYVSIGNLGIASKSNATVSISGCRLQSRIDLSTSSAKYTLNNVILYSCYVYNSEKLAIKGSVVFERTLYLSSPTNFLPQGYVLMECQGNGAWIRRYDHQTSLPYWLGPSEKTGSVAVKSCTLHKLNSATYQNATNHSGTCIYCAKSVSLPHDLTLGSSYSDTQHYAKCSLCNRNITSDLRYHDYGEDGKCVACSKQAPVSVHGHYSPQKTYFSSFDEAFKAVNAAGMYDTITMYQNQTYSLTETLDAFHVYYMMRSAGSTRLKKVYTNIWNGPHIHIAAGTYTLSNNGGTISAPAPTLVTGTFVYSLDISGNTATLDGSLKSAIKPAQGYLGRLYSNSSTKTSVVYIYPCPHTSTQVAQVKDENGNLMGYHSRTCTDCKQTWYWDHARTGNSMTCDTCSIDVSKTIAARVTYPGLSTPIAFSTLKDAWDYSVRYSHTYGRVYTIQVLKDIQLRNENSTMFMLEIPEQYKNANIVLDATDDNGKVRKIMGWTKYTHTSTAGTLTVTSADKLINLEYGHLTIKSGIYQGGKYGVYTNNYEYLTLEGGTFQNGILYNQDNSPFHVYDGLYSKNGRTPVCMAQGYALLVKETGTWGGPGLYGKFTGGRYGASLNMTIWGANGEVIPCPHPTAKVTERELPTCFTPGCPKNLYCVLCNQYVNMETGEQFDAWEFDPPTLGMLSHSFDAKDDCIHCGVHKNGVLYIKYNASGTMLANAYCTGFTEAWKKVATDAKTAPEGYSYALRLDADETMNVAKDLLLTYFPSRDVTIRLNGHSLNVAGELLRLNPNSNSNLTVIDPQKTGSLTCGELYMSDQDGCLTLDGVRLNTTDLTCRNLVMQNGAGIHFDGGALDNSTISVKNVTMEQGCWLEGEGCSQFALEGVLTGDVYEYDFDEAIVDLNHTLQLEQQDCLGNWIPALGVKNYFKFLSADSNGKRDVSVRHKVTNSLENKASSCYRWRAVREDVKHNLVGRWCNYCSFNTHHYNLIDKSNFSNSSPVDYTGVEYTRTFSSANVWEPLYIPMSVAPGDYTQVCDIADIYSFGRMCDTNGDGKIDDNDATWLIVDLMTSGETDPNYPYLIRAKQKGDLILEATDGCLSKSADNTVSCSTSRTKYSFTGIQSSKYLYSSNNDFYVDNNGVISAVTKSSQLLPAQRWYMKMTQNSSGYRNDLQSAQASGIRIMLIGEDLSEETAIQLLKGESVEVDLDGQRYTLDGRKATHTQSGIQVLNGHKILVK